MTEKFAKHSWFPVAGSMVAVVARGSGGNRSPRPNSTLPTLAKSMFGLSIKSSIVLSTERYSSR